ncbi:hypothetical protein O7634_22455 [Micromonospora sp. WMMD1120]|uniref:hypothetical protein n=1 Tax=Micromonospora sp. WMMD1120 TaxID=3016106 RepID=UPI00241789D6|nr:hypothetical protein [Micromonospora sp. WMMD1120]MDG4809519.1 hypothetical protein [Micromonospora sp. WMMD1120]
MALIAVAVGAGFLLAALTQEPAAADGARGGPGHEADRTINDLTEPIVRLTVGRLPAHHDPPATGADDRRRGEPSSAPAGRDGVVPTRRATPPAEPRESTAGTRGRVRAAAPATPPPVRHGDQRRASGARPEQHPVRDLRRSAHRHTGPPAALLPDPHVLRDPHVLPDPHVLRDTAGWPVLDLVTAPLPHVVDIVPIRPVVRTLLRLVTPVLPPAPGPVIVPRSPPMPDPPTPLPVSTPGSAPAPQQAPVPPSAPESTSAHPHEATAAPPLSSVHDPAAQPASTGHRAAPPTAIAARVDAPRQPVAPVDQDAACVNDGSTSGHGLTRSVRRQLPPAAEQPCDLAPLVLKSRPLSTIARPG